MSKAATLYEEMGKKLGSLEWNLIVGTPEYQQVKIVKKCKCPKCHMVSKDVWYDYPKNTTIFGDCDHVITGIPTPV